MQLAEKKRPLASDEEEEDEDSASVDAMSTQESVDTKGDEEDDDDDDVDDLEEDDEEEEEIMTEEDDDEDMELTEEELLDKDGKRSVAATGASVSDNGSAAPAVKRVKKKVRISDVSTVHGNNDNNEEEEGDDEHESTAEEDEDEDIDEFEDEEEDMEDDNEKHQQAAALNKIELSDSASMLRMIRSLPDEEARRHEQFRRAHFERGAIKRCMAKVIQECSAADRKVPSVNNVMAIVMAGMTKVFVGELTAEARRIMDKHGETGPIRPRHLREAHRKYYARRPLARGRNLRRLFR